MGKDKNIFKDVGKNVSYKEASAIAAKTGSTVDKVYQKAQNQGFTTHAGAVAGRAGYVPTNANVRIAPTYMQGAAQYQQQQMAAAQQAGQAQQAWVANGGQASGQPMPEFDWAAWNAQMMAQQQAVWSSMDAMNAEFLAQQEQLRGLNPQQQRGGTPGYGSSQADPAAVKRNKRTKKTGSTVNTGVTNKTLSLGGSNPGASNGLSIGQQT